MRYSKGEPLPLGATPLPDGVNFSLFSSNAYIVSLCLFKPHESRPFIEIPLDPKTHRSGDLWHILVHDLPHDYAYGYRVDGPFDLKRGHRFDNSRILLDPYAKLMLRSPTWGGDFSPREKTFRAVVNPMLPFEWEEDKRLHIPHKDLVIYEMHVRGFTQDRSSKVQNPGTFAGIVEKIPYLQELGVNAVELLPIHVFNERDNHFTNTKTALPLTQYWGYSSLNFFSLMWPYSGKGNPIIEFKKMVKALHSAGIEVILDVVYNHTGEGDGRGMTSSFRGIDNAVYYMLGPTGEYLNYSGCGNTLSCNHPVVQDLIVASLRYFASELHVDGFRFDLASALVRDEDGRPLEQPPLISEISKDPLLTGVKLIAEAWDAAGLYQVGSFPGGKRWSEWNGQYRDVCRRFIKGAKGSAGQFASRLCGSQDIYKKRLPTAGVNFITAHDGFSLCDLVSYNSKHNADNGEEGRDGMNDNESWNCGVEGRSRDPAILNLRQRQMRNFHLALMVSQGIPMVLMGDEYGHTKWGNNNTWGHDSRINWMQWDTLEDEVAFVRFYAELIAFRKAHPLLTTDHFLREREIEWHGKEPLKPNWGTENSLIAFTRKDSTGKYELYIAFNASAQESTVKLPGMGWKRIVDTAKLPPEDIIAEERAPLLETFYSMPPYSAVLFKRNQMV